MRAQATRFGWVLRLDAGEEIISTIREFAERHEIRCGTISGLGAVGVVELGFFVREKREYVVRRFEGEHEIGSLTGNLSELEGKPFPHCHIVIGGGDFVAHTGHLFSGVVTVACEVSLITDPLVLVRLKRPDLGFHPLEPSGE